MACGPDGGRPRLRRGVARRGSKGEGDRACRMHPGLTFQQEVDSRVCGHKAPMNIYDAPGTATLAEYVSWYRTGSKARTTSTRSGVAARRRCSTAPTD